MKEMNGWKTMSGFGFRRMVEMDESDGLNGIWISGGTGSWLGNKMSDRRRWKGGEGRSERWDWDWNEIDEWINDE